MERIERDLRDRVVNCAIMNGVGGKLYSYSILSKFPNYVIFYNEFLDDFGVSKVDLENNKVESVYYTQDATRVLKSKLGLKKAWTEYTMSHLFKKLMACVITD